MAVLKNNKIKIFTLLIAVVLLLSACGGSNQDVAKFGAFKPAEDSESIDGVVAENDKYRLLWDDAEKLISVYDKSDGSVYTTTKIDTEEKVNEFGIAISQDSRMLSDILLTYLDPESLELTTVNSKTAAVDLGSVTCEKIDNGIRVTYFFESCEIAVPVEYTISDRGFSLSVDPSKITENECTVDSISIAPFACSYKNDAVDSYLFIPSGSGALAYPQNISDNGTKYSQEIYGTDPTVETYENSTNEQNVKLPVYGVKNGDTALCAIISSGEQAASIDALYGSSVIGSSSVYSTFKVRGTSFVRKTLYISSIREYTDYTDTPISSVCKVDFYILKGDQANYNGMAKVFRENALTEQSKETDDSAMNLVIYGGASITKSFLGIPYSSVYPATTLEQAYQIVKELTEETGAGTKVMLKGFGETGIDIGKIGGGYKINSNFGSVSDLNKLGEYCKEKGIELYFDFDVVRQSASGWLASGDTAKAIDKQTVYQYLYDKAIKQRDTNTKYTILSRNSLLGTMDKIISKTAKWNIDGIALDTISNIAYSDYSSPNYSAKENIGTDVSGMFKKLQDSGKKVASVSANFYAANSSDVIFETPSTSNRNDIFALDIPFYQMVFKGNTNIGCESVNLAYNYKDAVLKSVESGAGITYSIFYNYDTSLADVNYPVFTTGTYGSIKQDIVDEVKALKEYYDSVADTSIKEHILINEDVRKTVFENGTVAYVNYSDKDYTGDFGTVAAHGYLTVPSAE